MAKKAKWLEEGTQESLLLVIQGHLTSEESDEKSQKKAVSAVTELIERLPQGEVTIIDNIDNLVTLADTIKAQYQTELDMVADEDEIEDEPSLDEEDIEEASDLTDYTKKELKAMAKELGIKVGKKAEKEEIIALIEEAQTEDIEDEEEADDESEATEFDEILSELDLKALKGLAKKAGITAKGKKQEALIDELAAHEDIEEILEEAGLLDTEDEDDTDEEDVDYSEMSKTELKALMKERGFKVSKKTTVEEMIETLENN